METKKAYTEIVLKIIDFEGVQWSAELKSRQCGGKETYTLA